MKVKPTEQQMDALKDIWYEFHDSRPSDEELTRYFNVATIPQSPQAEAVAFGIADDDGEIQDIEFDEAIAKERAQDYSWTVVPLYTAPQADEAVRLLRDLLDEYEWLLDAYNNDTSSSMQKDEKAVKAKAYLQQKEVPRG